MNDDYINWLHHNRMDGYKKLRVTPNELRKYIKRRERKLSWLKFKYGFCPGPCRRERMLSLEDSIEVDKMILKAMEGES